MDVRNVINQVDTTNLLDILDSDVVLINNKLNLLSSAITSINSSTSNLNNYFTKSNRLLQHDL